MGTLRLIGVVDTVRVKPIKLPTGCRYHRYHKGSKMSKSGYHDLSKLTYQLRVERHGNEPRRYKKPSKAGAETGNARRRREAMQDELALKRLIGDDF